MGSPNLADTAWLYGSAPQEVVATIHCGGKSAMPTWDGLLDAATITSLAVDVHELWGGM
ncbi:Cbb3-type cytochrome c oxidase subunit FixP [Methylobacterium frigidaeris]|uniref:Cbb3-type cytochrome c oxidase subunit FixP n=1 Tax=Methylobacterium frigidaeris TaxID=2038277 RepID=A0AA37M7X1_9HYPH|nr:hypothetical protein [Methylobacterium frigidaeris]GJD66398.1 Cbb3-type cytochrome c oxidase subunit FixP [Methylobacterium frigidaeris]